MRPLKKIIRYSVVIVFISTLALMSSSVDCFARTKRNASGRALSAQSAIIVDVNNNNIIYAKNIHVRRQPASTMKLLTALVAFERLGLDTSVTSSKKACCVEPSKVYLQEGAALSSFDLIHAVLMSSANDASIALAEAVAGSEWQFAQLMNEKAQRLGANNSHFMNATGLPAANQYTTAYDLYRIAKAALDNPIFVAIMKKKGKTIEDDQGKEMMLRNHNKMLFRRNYPLVLGKTGFTHVARHCFAGEVYYGNDRYVIVVLKSNKLWYDVEQMLRMIERNR